MTVVRVRKNRTTQELVKDTPLYQTIVGRGQDWTSLARLIVSFFSDCDCRRLGAKMGEEAVLPWKDAYAKNGRGSLSSNKNLLHDLLVQRQVESQKGAEDFKKAAEVLCDFLRSNARLRSFALHAKEYGYE